MKSQRLIFEKFRNENFDQYFQLVNDIEVMRMITGRTVSEAEAKVRYEKILTLNENKNGTGYFAIFQESGYTFIGLAKFVKCGTSEAEIGYMIIPEFWGMGYGSEISNMLVAYAKNSKKYKSLMAIIDPKNLASKRILMKSKFRIHEVCEIDGLPGEIYRLKLNQKS